MTIICRQLFAGHLVGSRPMKRKMYFHRMLIDFNWHVRGVAWNPFTFLPLLWSGGVSLLQKTSFEGSPYLIFLRIKVFFFISSPCINNIFGLLRSESRLYMQLSRRLSLFRARCSYEKMSLFLKHGSRQDNTLSTLGVSQCFLSPPPPPHPL